MPYTTRNNIKSYISGTDLIPFLDDDNKGQESTGLFDAIVATCSTEANGYVASIYATPFADPAPAKIQAATTIFVCEALYARRLAPDEKNPFKSRADMWRKLLAAVGNGEAPLDESFTRAFVPGAVILDNIVINKTTL